MEIIQVNFAGRCSVRSTGCWQRVILLSFKDPGPSSGEKAYSLMEEHEVISCKRNLGQRAYPRRFLMPGWSEVRKALAIDI